MMRSIAMVLLLITSFLIGACGKRGTKPVESAKPAESKPMEEVPDWITNPPTDPDYFFASATGVSADMQLAIEKAEHDATAGIARQIAMRVSELRKKFDEEVGSPASPEILQLYSKVSKIVVDETVKGCRVRKRAIRKEGVLFRAYVLMEAPVIYMKENLVDQIEKAKKLYTRYRASESFQELKKEVEEYRKFKEKEKREFEEFEEK